MQGKIYQESKEELYTENCNSLLSFLKKRKYHEAIAIFYFARQVHNNQYRLDNSPYFGHPVNTTLLLISRGVTDETILQAALLHDILEESNLLPDDLIKENIKPSVVYTVELLSKKSGLSNQELEEYYTTISQNKVASLIKLADRLDNLSTLFLFDEERRKKYISETQTFILDKLMRNVKRNFPEISFVLHYGFETEISAIIENIVHIQKSGNK